MRNLRLALLVPALALVPLAAAVSVDRASVAAHPEARGWPASLHVVFLSPPEYEREYVGRGGDDGQWIGPEYWASAKRDLGGRVTLGWDLDVVRGGTVEQAIAAGRVFDWPLVAQGTETVQRRIGGRQAGSLVGRWILTRGTPMAGDARHEAVLALPLCGVWGVAKLSAMTPASDSAGGAMGFGEYLVNGTVTPSVWARQKLEESLGAIVLEGSLPAARVTAKASRRVLTGKATDCQRLPSAALPAILERRVGRAWKRVRTIRTSATGTYRTTAPSAGTYRVRVGSRASAALRLR